MPIALNPDTGNLDRINNLFYHGTTHKALPSILKQGLLGGLSIHSRLGFGGSFITKSLEKARTMGEVILEIRLPSNWKLEYDESPYDFESPGGIPAVFIKRILK